MEKIKLVLKTEAARMIWANAERTAARVAAWPAWKRGVAMESSDVDAMVVARAEQLSDATRIAAGLLDDLKELSDAERIRAVAMFIRGVHDGALEQAAVVSEAGGHIAANIRARKYGKSGG